MDVSACTASLTFFPKHASANRVYCIASSRNSRDLKWNAERSCKPQVVITRGAAQFSPKSGCKLHRHEDVYSWGSLRTEDASDAKASQVLASVNPSYNESVDYTSLSLDAKAIDYLENDGDADGAECDYEDGEAWLVDEMTTPFNKISVIELDEGLDNEFSGAYVLKLDDANLIHSVFWRNGRVWTSSYYDVFASLPPLLPEGTVGILGLGAGTVARILLHAWPSLLLEGWELDPEVVRVGRAYFGLTNLEVSGDGRSTRRKLTGDRFRSSDVPYRSINPEAMEGGGSQFAAEVDISQRDANNNGNILIEDLNLKRTAGRHVYRKAGRRRGGFLVVHVGDALGPAAIVEGGFAGLIVDLFSNGRLCEELSQVSTWTMLKDRLKPGGRVMVNCVANCGGLKVEGDKERMRDWDRAMQSTIIAMDAAFSGDVSIRQLRDEGRNVMLLSGKMPDLDSWSAKVPDCLVEGVGDWKPWLQ